MPDPPAQPERSTSTVELVILGALVVAVAVWMSAQRPSPASPAEAADATTPAADPTAASGFRSDAWSLPDDELLGFVEIPAGPFLMGSDAAIDPLAFDNERWSGPRAQGTVDLPAYYLGRHEVTVAQFRAFVDGTGFDVDDQALRGPPTHPVGSITWPDALAYCRWLEAKLRASPETPAPLGRFLRDGGRVSLPSEAEWEKAARGTDGRIYPWGNRAEPGTGELRRDAHDAGRLVRLRGVPL